MFSKDSKTLDAQIRTTTATTGSKWLLACWLLLCLLPMAAYGMPAPSGQARNKERFLTLLELCHHPQTAISHPNIKRYNNQTLLQKVYSRLNSQMGSVEKLYDSLKQQTGYPTDGHSLPQKARINPADNEISNLTFNTVHQRIFNKLLPFLNWLEKLIIDLVIRENDLSQMSNVKQLSVLLETTIMDLILNARHGKFKQNCTELQNEYNRAMSDFASEPTDSSKSRLRVQDGFKKLLEEFYEVLGQSKGMIDRYRETNPTTKREHSSPRPFFMRQLTRTPRR